ncbi:MAG: hypothetical protein D4R45_07735 [Planctomycetaceae bacterium]|nr:MAG: hypothetical protein D4R45_07735 [Planctomycetaceae bacterium]
MALGQKYQILTRDRHSILWTTKIFEEGYEGDITSFTGAGGLEPSKRELCNESDDPFDPIKSSREILAVWCETMFALDELFTAEDMYYPVEIYQGEDLYWCGFVDPGQSDEDYGPVPYEANIFCIDGLALLKNYKFEESDGVPYNGRETYSQIIFDILGKIGYTTFKEFINIYETGMDSGVGDSPLDQEKIDRDVFTDMYCDEVLKQLLGKFNACIRQVDGVFCLFRPAELNGATVYGRLFTSAYTKSAISITPKQFINRSGYSSAYCQIRPSKIIRTRPASKATIFQDYGYKESLIENWEAKGSTYDEDTYSWQSWINSVPIIYSINRWMPGELDGIALVASSAKTYYVSQSFGNYLKMTDNILSFSIDYLLYTFYGSNLAGVQSYIKVKADNANYWLYEKDENYLVWVASETYITIYSDIENGKNGWFNYSRSIPDGLPVDGPYTITLYGPYSASTTDLIGCWKNVKAVSTADAIINKSQLLLYKKKKWWAPSTPYWYIIKEIYDKKEIVEREYTHDNEINGTPIERNMLLGDVADSNIDNVIEMFAGSLALFAEDTRAEAAANFDTEKSGSYYGIDTTHSGDDIIFTSTDGEDFTGASSIVNTDGDLAGSVVNTQAHAAGTPEIDKITLSGSSGSATISCGGISKVCEYLSNPGVTATQFVIDFDLEWAAINIELTSAGADLFFTEIIPEGGFVDAAIVNIDGDLTGTKYDIQEPVACTPRIDTITLSGDTGSADITVDGVTEEVNIDETLTPTTTWNRRGHSDSKALLQITYDEIAEQNNRAKQLIDMAIRETDVAASTLNLLGNFQDAINVYGSHLRSFIINRGTFSKKLRQWQLDLVEIGIGDAPVNDELETYMTELTTPLSDGQLFLLDTLITSLKTGLSINSLSDAFDCLWILAGETAESSLKNLVKNAHHCTLVNTPVFAQYEGYTGNPEVSKLDTNYNPNTQASRFAQDNAGGGIYSRTTRAPNLNAHLGGRYFLLRPWRVTTLARVNVNSHLTYINTECGSTCVGVTAAYRFAVDNCVAVKNKTFSTVNTNVSTGMDNINFDICNDSIQVAIAYCGKALIQAEHNTLIDAFETYMDARGKGVCI